MVSLSVLVTGANIMSFEYAYCWRSGIIGFASSESEIPDDTIVLAKHVSKDKLHDAVAVRARHGRFDKILLVPGIPEAEDDEEALEALDKFIQCFGENAMRGVAVRQHALMDALRPGLCLTVDDLEAVTPLSRRAISQAATALIFRGLLERVEIGCYQLTGAGVDFKASGAPLNSGPIRPKSGHYKRRPKSMRTRIWRALAVMDKFTIRDVVSVTAHGGERDALNNAGRYLRDLCRAGYLRRMAVRERDGVPTSNGLVRYTRLRHTGPIAPTKRQSGMFDHNLQELVPWIG